MNFQRLAFLTSVAIPLSIAIVIAVSACGDKPPSPVPQARQAAEAAPAPVDTAPAAVPVPLDPPPILRAEPGTPGHTVSNPAPAPKAAASNAKAATKKTAKPGDLSDEEYATLEAQFYAEHAKCIGEVVDAKIAGDIKLGIIRDFGNIRESSVCGYDYFDPATGRLPPRK